VASPPRPIRSFHCGVSGNGAGGGDIGRVVQPGCGRMCQRGGVSSIWAGAARQGYEGCRATRRVLMRLHLRRLSAATAGRPVRSRSLAPSTRTMTRDPGLAPEEDAADTEVSGRPGSLAVARPWLKAAVCCAWPVLDFGLGPCLPRSPRLRVLRRRRRRKLSGSHSGGVWRKLPGTPDLRQTLPEWLLLSVRCRRTLRRGGRGRQGPRPKSRTGPL
jgi:hypothetical protein